LKTMGRDVFFWHSFCQEGFLQLKAASDWWDEVDESLKWQDGIYYALCAAYSLVAAVDLVSDLVNENCTLVLHCIGVIGFFFLFSFYIEYFIYSVGTMWILPRHPNASMGFSDIPNAQ